MQSIAYRKCYFMGYFCECFSMSWKLTCMALTGDCYMMYRTSSYS